ncbi:hypothetical protein ACJMK2_036307 [Sinanodonta woodiana]|uniref:G-protein coupled receptors family 1 profile domain-containing protein n=1 Tax=Sinanodonta woodiana TaxID=1069815 RepID=A0ABD3WIX0_SINWO
MAKGTDGNLSFPCAGKIYVYLEASIIQIDTLSDQVFSLTKTRCAHTCSRFGLKTCRGICNVYHACFYMMYENLETLIFHRSTRDDMYSMFENLTIANDNDGVPTYTFEGSVHTATQAVCTVLVIFVLILGCTGNGMVLFHSLKKKKLRNNFDLLIINLAGADFMLCTCLAPLFLFLLFSDPPTPRVFCGSILFLGTLCGMLSLISLVSIAIHRQARVTGYIKGSLSLAQTGIVVLLVWVISMAISLGGTFHITTFWSRVSYNCQYVVNSPKRMENNFILFFIAPVAIVSFVMIAISYGIISWTVRQQNQCCLRTSPQLYKFKKSPELLCKECLVNKTFNSSPVKNGSPPPRPSPPNKGSKALTMCLVVILTIVLCWGPLIISQAIEVLIGESIILYQVKLCGIALVFLNSALNPYVYGQNNGRIKYKYGKLLYSLIRCEYVVQKKTKLRAIRKRTPEMNRLKLSHNTQDTITFPAGSPKHSRKVLNGCFNHDTHTGIRHMYMQNILLLQSNRESTENNKITQQNTNAKYNDSIANPIEDAERSYI